MRKGKEIGGGGGGGVKCIYSFRTTEKFNKRSEGEALK